ncbi:MAG: hypothetical protein ABI999_05990 [Acidobacteriota bacterium]
MKRLLFFLFPFILVVGQDAAQQPVASSAYPAPTNQLDSINVQLDKIGRSVDKLQSNWKDFFRSFSTNQGLQMTERQQKLLMAFEVLNRAEQRLGNLQKIRMDATEKQSSLRLQLARVNDDLIPESIDKYVAARGSLDAEQLRDIRRQALIKQRSEITNILNQVEQDLFSTNEEIRSTEQFLRSIRGRIFPELLKELADL